MSKGYGLLQVTLLFLASVSVVMAADSLPVLHWLQHLQQEGDALLAALLNVSSAWHALLHGSDNSGLWQVVMHSGLPLLLIFPLRWLTKFLARYLVNGIIHWHNQIVSSGLRHQGARAMARLASGVTPLLPWGMLLWLSTLVPAPDKQQMGLGGALLILFQVYVLYVLLKLASEWFLQSICQGAGNYMNAESTSLLELRTRSSTSWLLLPWVLIALTSYLFTQSVIGQLVGAIVWLFSWLVICRLLYFYREELILNLKRLLPQSMDPLIEKVGHGKLMTITLPLWIPFNLLLFIKAFVSQLLAEFSWFQKLNARWFRMKNQNAENEADDDVSERIDDDYLHWFSDDGEWEYPIIDTGLSAAIRKNFDLWDEERSNENVLLICGEPGIGKNSAARRFANTLTSEKSETQIRLIDVPAKTISADALYQLLGEALNENLAGGPAALVEADKHLSPTLIIINDAENLFLAEVGAFDGWRSLLSLTNAQLQNVFWVIVINNQSWAYLCNVFGRDYQIKNVIRAKRWSQSDIRSLILSRNQKSGYRLQYDEVLIDTRSQATQTVRNAEQRYFSLLWDACRGNPVTALKLWKESVSTLRNVATVRIPRLPASARIEKSSANNMFVYAALVTHGRLSTAEIMRVTDMAENVVRYALKSAQEDDVIEKGNDGRYSITALWYYTVTSTLNRMNMLNE